MDTDALTQEQRRVLFDALSAYDQRAQPTGGDQQRLVNAKRRELAKQLIVDLRL